MQFDASALPLYSVAQVRAMDLAAQRRLHIPGIQLMRRAARAVLQRIELQYDRSLAVFCGHGNNGGDGYLVAALARERGYTVEVFEVAATRRSDDAAQARATALAAGVPIAVIDERTKVNGKVIVDALLGIGGGGELRGDYALAIAAVERARLAGAHVIAVDVPSGICADSGRDFGAWVRANQTVTFIAYKRGLFTHRGAAAAGTLHLAPLDLPPSLRQESPPSAIGYRWGEGVSPWPIRERDAHKGHFGHVLVIGGGNGMGGAAALAAEAALRSGAGLVSVACSVENVAALLARRPEVMVRGVSSVRDLTDLLAKASHLVVGPGLGRNGWALELLEAALASGRPVVLDADALNLVVDHGLQPKFAVITPHPGEAGRLLNLPAASINEDRFGAARALVTRWGAVTVLKGAGTLIDNGTQVAICRGGNPGMASGGMGDVLSGVIGGLWAQLGPASEHAFAAAVRAVALHAAAADAAAGGGERGLLAGDLMPGIRALNNGRSP